MKYYEILYIVNPNLEQDRLNEVKKEVADEVARQLAAETINHRIFGKKRLSFTIDKQKYGIYMILHLGTEDSTNLPELNTFFKLNKNILRHIVVRLDARPEEDLSPEVDTQESGRRKPTTTGEQAAPAEKETTAEEKPKAEEKPETDAEEPKEEPVAEKEPVKEEAADEKQPETTEEPEEAPAKEAEKPVEADEEKTEADS